MIWAGVAGGTLGIDEASRRRRGGVSRAAVGSASITAAVGNEGEGGDFLRACKR